jgi:FkbM family methyltransferase
MKFASVEHEVIYKKLVKNMNGNTEGMTVDRKGSDPAGIHEHFAEISRYISIMDQNRVNLAHRPIFSHRKVLGPFIVLGKKVVRKFLKWYLDPVALQQTEFNNAVTPAIGRLTELAVRDHEKIEALKKQLQEQSEQHDVKLDMLKKQLQEQLEQHDVKLDMLKKQLQEQLEQHDVKLDMLKKQLQEQLEQHDVKLDMLEKQVQEAQNLLAGKFSELEEKLNKFEAALQLNLDAEKSIFEKETYSQSGEDSILCYLLHVLGIPFESVTYVDLGANHAKEMNNTYFFYKMGGRGVLVEANPQLIPELKFYRNQDIVLNRCIAAETGNFVDFYILSGDGLSTLRHETAKKYMEINPGLKIMDQVQVETISYNDLVEQYLGHPPTILSIDIEGNELEILRSIDFEKYRPKFIVAEMIGYDTKLNYRSKNEEIKAFLESQGYDEYAFTGINSIFLDRTLLEGKA